jgi:hypothetical protein
VTVTNSTYFVQRIWGLFSNPGGQLLGITDSANPPTFLFPVSGQSVLPSGDATGVQDATAINTAIANLVSGAGGGVVTLAPGTWYLSSLVTLQSNVVISMYGVSLQVLSGGGINCPSTGVVQNAGILGGQINTGTLSTTPLALLSCYQCLFRDFTFVTNSLTQTVITMGCNITGSVNRAGNYNCAENVFENVNQDTASGGVGCGTWVSLSGNDANHVVTLNTWIGCSANLVNAVGYDGLQWGDSNHLVGNGRINLNGNISPANGIGFRFGHGGAGIYNWTGQFLAVDAFGTPATDNRVAIVADNQVVKGMDFWQVEFGPAGSSFFGTITGLVSCSIQQIPRSASNYQSMHMLGTNMGLGMQALTNAVLVTQNAGQVSGTSQYGYFAETPGFNSGSPALVAGYGSQPSLASASGAYNVAQVMAYYAAAGALGTNATATTFYSYYDAGQTQATTTNYGYYTGANVGAGPPVNWGFYAAGTAPNFFAGPTAVGGSITNDNASAGFVGQILTSVVGSGSAVSLTTATPANVTSLSLTAGDWDVWGHVCFEPAGTTTISAIIGSVSTTSGTLGTYPQQTGSSYLNGGTPGTSINPTQDAPHQRISLATTTTVYLVAQATFATSTLSAYGAITARRRR